MMISLKVSSQDLESKHSDVTDGEGMPILQATWPCSSIQYQNNPIPVLDITNPEPDIGSINNW